MKPLFEGLFEAHLTIAPPPADLLPAFRAAASRLGAKAVFIELARGDSPQQPMTASRHRGPLPEVMQAVTALADALRSEGFSVTRVKVEAAPDALGVPQNAAEQAQLPAHSYFEHHAKLLLPQGFDTQPLLPICAKHSAHLSRNAFKHRDDGLQERFVTARNYGLGLVEAQARYAALHADLKSAGFTVLKGETEYCVHDSNVALDANWLGS